MEHSMSRAKRLNFNQGCKHHLNNKKKEKLCHLTIITKVGQPCAVVRVILFVIRS
jgi:hypothetical protein